MGQLRLKDGKMTMSMSELRSQLSAIEANETMYAGIGSNEIPLLVELLRDKEGWLAARAVHALVRLDAEGAREAVRAATRSERPEVREAIAASAGQLPTET